jgi:hypothetical protein
MFAHKHYVPVLKGKRAEFPALANLRSRDGLTPLMEAVPGADIQTVPRKMSTAWDANRPYFIDALFWDDEDWTEADASRHPLHACFTEVRDQGQRAIPVTGTDRSPAYQFALRTIAQADRRGFAIRLTLEDFEDEGALPPAIDELEKIVGVPRSEIDMLIDAGSVTHLPSAAAVTRMYRGLLDVLPGIDDWRTLTIIGGAFPLSLAPLTRNAWNAAPRYDWQGWTALLTRPRERYPSFGDYAIAHPSLPPSGRATILAQLRYTLQNEYLIYKGQDAIDHGYGQFFAICADLVSRPQFSGAQFSYGDGMIHARATTGGSPGNAETWRTIGTSHHVEMVIHQIANLP